MKTKKKGFSLVELICTLTIAAIIAVAAAPNVSAYILNSKIQNYQTALNNLVDELQTKLPQTRYWNWQEVKDNTEEILTSDISRNVSAPVIEGSKYTYTLSNVSTDSNVEFSLSVEYGSPSLTQQEITISGECVGYDAVKSENNTCTVLLKGNYVDRENYPKYTINGNVQSDKGGWKPMIAKAADAKTMADIIAADPDHNFLNGRGGASSTPLSGYVSNDEILMNTTDFPVNSINYVAFEIPRRDYYNRQLFPYVTVQDGIKMGKFYSPMESPDNYYFGNIEVYIGDSSIELVTGNDTESLKKIKNYVETDSNWMSLPNWVTNYNLFETFINWLYYNNNENKYTNWNNNKVFYRVKLEAKDASSVNSKGWIALQAFSKAGTMYDPDNPSKIATAYLNNKLYANVNIEEEYKAPKLIAYKKGSWNSEIWLDASESGYCVGDTLEITFNNIDLPDGVFGEPWEYSGNSFTNKRYKFNGIYELEDANITFYDGNYKNEIISIINGFQCGVEEGDDLDISCVYDKSSKKVVLNINFRWYDYPYIKLTPVFRKEIPQVELSMEFKWKHNNSTETVPITVDKPIITINGNDKYTILTFDWSHCDYITASNIGNMHIEFDKELSFEVYDKNYTEKPYNHIYGEKSCYINQIENYNDILSDGIVHLYFKGVSANDVKYTIKDAPTPPSTSTSTTTPPGSSGTPPVTPESPDTPPVTPETPVTPDTPPVTPETPDTPPVTPETPPITPETPENPGTSEPTENSFILKNLEYGKSYDISQYDYSNIKRVVIKVNSEARNGCGGDIYFGNYQETFQFNNSHITSENIIEYNVSSPQSTFTIRYFWGNMTIESITFYYE